MQFVAGTAGLWWTYMDKKRFIDDKEDDNIPLLNVDIDSEQAFMIYSIIATVLTVCTSKIVKVQNYMSTLEYCQFPFSLNIRIASTCILLIYCQQQCKILLYIINTSQQVIYDFCLKIYYLWVKCMIL